jgi:CheY-like chemotaxis protein/HPt (histidine-containing phosphotransfer) domain-containing protein
MSNRIAASPEQAVDLLAQAAARGAPYDIAIIDLALPGMDALDLARQIRARADIAKVRLVVLTRRQADLKNARDVGIDACLAKPVRQTMLYECLVNVMAGQPQEAAAAPAVTEPAGNVSADARGRILLVEDNLINQQVALGILQIQGYTVTVVNNGREALDAHAQGTFDLILMDCHMPEMDGFEATREIRSRERASGQRIPVVALTANAMAQDREACLNAGMDDHLSKPFSMLTLQNMLDKWMQPKAAAAEAPTPAPRTPAPKKGEVIDRLVLEQLGKVLTNGKPELLTRVINLYLVESPKLVLKLKQAAGASNAPDMASAAHSLKSSSANVGAKALSRHCEELETLARRGETDEARRMLAKVEKEHRSVQRALTEESESLGARV